MAEIIFAPSDNPAEDKALRRRQASGELIKAATGIYVTRSHEPVETTILRNWSKIAGKLVPDGVITDRTGFENKPFKDRSAAADAGAVVYMSAPRTRNILRVPGLGLVVRSIPKVTLRNLS